VTAYLLDTNVVVRLMEPAAAEHEMVKEAIRRLIRAGHALVLAPQVTERVVGRRHSAGGSERIRMAPKQDR